MANSASTFERLSAWYLRHCDGTWEHEFGFTISTLDNPGVEFDIDLVDTELAEVPFEEIKQDYESPDSWFICRRTKTKFEGNGAATRLEEMLRIFLDWADAHETI